MNAAYFGGVVEEAENQAGEEPKNERLEFEDEMALLGRRRVQAVGSFIPTMKKTREHEFKRMVGLLLIWFCGSLYMLNIFSFSDFFRCR